MEIKIKLKIPQIFKISVQWIFLILIIILLAVQKLFYSPTNIDSESRKVFENFNNPSSHLHLARVAALKGDDILAKRELIIYQNILNFRNLNRFSNLKELYLETEKLVYINKYLNSEKQYWENIINIQPYYRDGFLKLALIYFQLNEIDSARNYYTKARLIDPNNKMVSVIGSLINNEDIQ